MLSGGAGWYVSGSGAPVSGVSISTISGFMGASRTQQLRSLRRRDAEPIERRHEILYQRIELARCDTHPLMGLLHLPTGVRARAARGLAHLPAPGSVQIRS
jgi:hypothetical protein